MICPLQPPLWSTYSDKPGAIRAYDWSVPVDEWQLLWRGGAFKFRVSVVGSARVPDYQKWPRAPVLLAMPDLKSYAYSGASSLSSTETLTTDLSQIIECLGTSRAVYIPTTYKLAVQRKRNRRDGRMNTLEVVGP